jgi:hypothetical protein
MTEPHKRAFRPTLHSLEDRRLLSAYGAGGVAAAVPAAHRAGTVGAFRAAFVGHFDVGPDRFNGSPRAVHVTSDNGSSSTSLHTNLRMALATFPGSADPVTGQAVFIDRNVTSSGSTLILDLKADGAALDSNGRPVSATWTVDGASGGLYSDATGSGTVTISYRPGKARASGTAVVRFSGQLLTTRLTNVINNL